jgi:predicted AAA+ superfamily ATPase
VVLLELERRGWAVEYVKTADGFEVDFLAHRPGDQPLLIQVSLETEGDSTWDRELRALVAVRPTLPQALPLLLTLDAVPPRRPLPDGVSWVPAARWLLEGT